MNDRSLKRKNFKKLQLAPESLAPLDFSSPPPPGPPPPRPQFAFGQLPPRTDRQHKQGVPNLDHLGPMENINECDLVKVSNLGHGNGGYVCKVLHKPSGLNMATKTITITESNSQLSKNIAIELDTLKICDSDFIVQYFGQYKHENQLVVCMEFMDCGSLDRIYKMLGPLPEEVLVHVNSAVADGLVYLKQLHITHRDIKPSNILVNRAGQVKLCDFGVSGVLVNSIVQTFVGTSMYMSPERVMGEPYTDAGDVWSLGISLTEMATGVFPMELVDSDGLPLPTFELLQGIVAEPAPKLPERFSVQFRHYVDQCLQKDPGRRIKVKQLRDTDFYLMAQNPASKGVLVAWASKLPTV